MESFLRHKVGKKYNTGMTLGTIYWIGSNEIINI